MLNRLLIFSASLLAVLPAAVTQAAPVHPEAESEALELAKQAISLRSVQGSGNETPKVAALYKRTLIGYGFAEKDVEITPFEDTAYLIARWPGSDPSLKPLVISGHMDVVEARREDWQRNPFEAIIEKGFLFGRGASDTKLNNALAIASIGELKRQGYRPRRSIIIEFSGDEETSMKTSEIIAQKLRNAELVLNTDGGGGRLDEATGQPKYFTWAGAEKIYANFEMTVTNPVGHSSQPRKINAITELSAALVRIGTHQFKPKLNDITRASLSRLAMYEDPKMAAAMRAFVADPGNSQAVETLTANTATIGTIGTTCVVTMINGGHDRSALPQRATANINCRIFPGQKPAEIMTELEKVANNPSISFKALPDGTVLADASPMRADVVAAIEKSIHEVYPGIPVTPVQLSGATDSAYFRQVGVPAYGIAPTFNKVSDSFAHGLNERIPIMNIRPAITYYLSLFRALSK